MLIVRFFRDLLNIKSPQKQNNNGCWLAVVVVYVNPAQPIRSGIHFAKWARLLIGCWHFFQFRFIAHDKSALKDLETIDDDLDREGVILVRLPDNNGDMADKYELDVVPCLMLLHEGRASFYKGEINDENEIIKWFRGRLEYYAD